MEGAGTKCDSGQVPRSLWALRPCPSCHVVPCAMLGLIPRRKNKEMTATVTLRAKPALVPNEICSNPSSTVLLGQLSHFFRPLFPRLQNGNADFTELHLERLGLPPERFPRGAIRVIVFICPGGCQPAQDRVGLGGWGAWGDKPGA